jgi:hypothetical protein
MRYESLMLAVDLPLIGLLSHWHDFYALIGSASATLVGLMFVAVSIGAGIFTRDHQDGIRVFFSPSVFHFSAILIVCLVATLPDETWPRCAVLLAICGLVGFGYCLYTWRRMVQRGLLGTIDAIDRLWYSQLPIVSYLLIVAAGAGLYRQLIVSLDLLALALITLLLIGLRNSWDMTLWIIGRRID